MLVGVIHFLLIDIYRSEMSHACTVYTSTQHISNSHFFNMVRYLRPKFRYYFIQSI